jgi:hypothetical protein
LKIEMEKEIFLPVNYRKSGGEGKTFTDLIYQRKELPNAPSTRKIAGNPQTFGFEPRTALLPPRRAPKTPVPGRTAPASVDAQNNSLIASYSLSLQPPSHI